MNSKAEFYQLYFKELQKKGFTVQTSTSPDYLADIFYKEKPIAFYSRADVIIKNPFVEVPEKLMDKLHDIAKATVMACGICTDRPYEEEQAQKLENQVVKINEHNGVVLACKRHELFGYVLSTYRKDTESKMPIQRQYFYNKEAAFESFAVRSGLVDEKKLFTETELKVIHAGLVKMRTTDNDMDSQDLESVGQLVDKIEDILPELQKREHSIDFMKMFRNIDFGMERD